MDSRYLSYLLRHHPEDANLHLDEYGWCSVLELLRNLRISKRELEDIVLNNTRFIYSDDKRYIKAAHGHSIPVKYTREKVPPDILYHGTADRFLEAIKNEGLKKMTREAVHLTCDYNLALEVGSRHASGNRNKTTILEIDANKMYKDGYRFYESEDHVWLVDNVPAKYILNI